MGNITILNTRTLATAIVDSSLYATYFFADPSWIIQNQAGVALPPDYKSVNGTLGESMALSMSEETLTLATGALFTDTVGNLLPAGAIILGVDVRVKTTITTAANFTVGDPTTAARFASASTNITAGQVTNSRAHWAGGTQVQVAASKVRITCNVNPGAGAVTICVYYILTTSQNQ